LRKHQDFLKVQKKLQKLRIIITDSRLFKEEGDNAEYWKNQLPFYQKSIDLAKEKVQEEIDYLLQKGVMFLRLNIKKSN
jgi:DNA-binding transcriptional regulator GbsR (MarR family)